MAGEQTAEELIKTVSSSMPDQYAQGDPNVADTSSPAEAAARSCVNWVLETKGFPTTLPDGPIPAIRTIVGAIRIIFDDQTVLCETMTEQNKAIQEVKHDQAAIRKMLDSLKLRSEQKEDKTLEVLKANMKLLQSQHDEMKQQLAELKNREPGEITESSETTKAVSTPLTLPPKQDNPRIKQTDNVRLGLDGRSHTRPGRTAEPTKHDPLIRRKMREITRQVSSERSSATEEEMEHERQYVKHKLTSLTRRVDTVLESVEKMKEDFHKAKESTETKFEEMLGCLNRLENIFVFEANELRINAVRNRTFAATHTESLKAQLAEMWQLMKDLEQHLGHREHRVEHRLEHVTAGDSFLSVKTRLDKCTVCSEHEKARDSSPSVKTPLEKCPKCSENNKAGNSFTSAKTRLEKCTMDENDIIYWRDKIINASNILDIDQRPIAFGWVAQDINTMLKWPDNDSIEHALNNKGLTFLKRLIAWWSLCYGDIKGLKQKVLKSPNGATKRRAPSEEAPQDYKRQQLTNWKAKTSSRHLKEQRKDPLSDVNRTRPLNEGGRSDKETPVGPSRIRPRDDYWPSGSVEKVDTPFRTEFPDHRAGARGHGYSSRAMGRLMPRKWDHDAHHSSYPPSGFSDERY